MSPRVQERRWRLAIRLTVAALVWSVGLMLAALLVSAYHGQAKSSADGLTLHSATLVQVHGIGALALTAVPAIASLLVAGALWRRRRTGDVWSERLAWLVIGALAVVALLGITYVGAFMLPVVALLALSVRLEAGSAGSDASLRPPIATAASRNDTAAAAPQTK
jgi:hypothetical protein